VNASTFTFTCSDDYPQFGQFVVYYTEAPAGPTEETVPLNHSANNTWAIAEMPGYDVELEVEYFNITVPTATTDDIYAGSTTPLINAGSTTEEGATMKYLVTATNEQPTSTDGFSADVPTAQAITAQGTYYVWYYLDLESGDDSDISALAVEVTVSAPAYAVTIDDASKDTDNWQATPAEQKAGQTVTLSYGGKKKIRSITIEKAATAPAGPTLAETMTTAGMTVKVTYNYNDEENYCLFLSNGDGTYTFQSGEGYAGGDKCAKALVVEDGKLVFKQNFFATIDDSWDDFGFSVTFDTSDNTYSQWVGEAAIGTFNPSFISVEVNGTQIAVTQALLQVTVHESDWSQGSGDHIIYYASGETWAEAIANHPTENAGWSVSNNFVYYNAYQVYDGSDAVMADNPIENGHYEF
jgi:hypothetical protein